MSIRNVLFLLVAVGVVQTAEARNIPFLKKKYTPLVFFTVPKGTSPENDALEKTVLEVEKELGVFVERLDVERDPPSQALLGLVTKMSPPFLYNRESCQSIHIQSPKASAGGSDAKRTPPNIERSRVRAWAKGRIVPSRKNAGIDADHADSPVVLSKKESAIEQEELLDMSLSPLQQKGKEAIKERAVEGSTKKN